ncbi:MAG: hypothetical protein NVSMB1_10900 [Polyangiales bacterium]
MRFTFLCGSVAALMACGNSGNEPNPVGYADGAIDGGSDEPPPHDDSSTVSDSTLVDDAPASDTRSVPDSAPPPKDSTTKDSVPGDAVTLPVCTTYTPPISYCGTERWKVKVGQDTATACSIGLSPTATTIASLRALDPGGSLPPFTRIAPTETTVFLLQDVTLVQFKKETDLDYHLVLQDGAGRTIIAEIPDPDCMPSSGPWYKLVKSTRDLLESKYSGSTSWTYPAVTVSVRGVGFFDVLHGQTGVAPNGIELHPILGLCFGAGCTP